MPIDVRLLEILCCPSCREAVRQLPDSDGVQCVACRRVYRLVDGILDMLVEEARVPGY